LFGTFGWSASEQPTGQAAARTAWSIGRSGLTGDARLRFIRLGLRFEPFWFNDGSCSRRNRALAIFRERLAGQHKRFFSGINGRGRTRSVGTAIIEITPRAAIFVAATIRIATTTAIASAVAATIWAAVTAAILTLRGSVFRWRKIASALAEPAASATSAVPASAAPEAASAAAPAKVLAVTAAVSATIRAAIAAAIRAAVTAWSITGRRTVLGRVVARSEILRSRFVRIGLTLVFCMNFIDTGGAWFGFFHVGVNVVMHSVRIAGFTNKFL
jgi:hypothetical protein